MSKSPASADAAIALVREYARLQDFIDGTRKGIGDALELCPGVNGHRKEEETLPGFDGESFAAPTERAAEDVTHLSRWYSPGTDYDGSAVWLEPTADECPHCFAAHEVVQRRRGAKRRLGSIKGRMRKLGRKLNGRTEEPTSVSADALPRGPDRMK